MLSSSHSGSTGENELQIPIFILREGGSTTPLNVEDSTSLILYVAEENRRRPGFFRRSGERLRMVSIVNYGLELIPLMDGHVLIVDPNRDRMLELKYKEVDIGEITAEVDRLGSLKGKAFVNQLISVSRLLEKSVKGEKAIRIKTFKIPGLIHHRALILELDTLIKNAQTSFLPSVKVWEKTINPDEITGPLRTILAKVDGTVKRLGEILTDLTNKYEKWLEDVRTSFAEEIHGVESKLEEVKKEVESRIKELQGDKEKEISDIKSKYEERLRFLDRRIREEESKVSNLEGEYSRAKEYGKETKEIKRKLGEAKKKIESLRKEREDLVKKMETEERKVSEKYDQLIANERRKITRLEKEIERLNKELETLEKQASDYMDTIRKHVDSLISAQKDSKDKILNMTIPNPPMGSGKYYVPAAIIEYKSKAKSRVDLITPALLSIPRLSKTAKINTLPEISGYLSIVKNYLHDNKYADDIAKVNLLLKFSPHELTRILEKLGNEKIVDSKKIGKIVSSIEEQAKILQSPGE